MTSIEDRLRTALAEEADSRQVDVLRMRAELDERLTTRRPRRGRTLAGLVAAAAVVAGVAVSVPLLDDGDAPATDTTGSAEVDDTFRCSETRAVDLSGAQDEFLPDLTKRTPAEIAEEQGARRWEFVESGDSAVLRLGNADGTLGSETLYERQDGRWQMLRARACSNGTPAAPTANDLRLGVHGGDPWPAEGLLAVGPQDVRSVLVDDRPVYEYSGLVARHRAIYLAPCGARLCFGVGDPTGGVFVQHNTFSGRDAGILGVDCNFFEPDDLVGRTTPYAMVVAWDATGRTTGLTVTGPGSVTYDGVSFTDRSWGRQQVWIALVPPTGRGVKTLARLHDADGVVDQRHAPVVCSS